MNLLTEKGVSGKSIDHLGLVAAIIKKSGIISKIDAMLPLCQNKSVKVTMGQRVSAMLLNGLGFMNNRLYMFSKFLDKKPVDRLFGQKIEARHFNDDALGRCLDAISDYGVTKFFRELSFSIGQEQGLLGRTIHGDTTTLLLYGDYLEQENTSANDRPSQSIPKYGHSKAKRNDLKQMILHLATTGSHGFPLWMESHDGNASDQKTLINAAKRMQQFTKALEVDQDFIYVGDSAFYSGAVQNTSEMKWISRVPEHITAAKKIVSMDDADINWTQLDNGYKLHCFNHAYKGVAQRWALIYSQDACNRQVKTLERNILKEQIKDNKRLWHLSNQMFKCASDAKKTVLDIKNLKYHQIDYSIEPVTKHANHGRPKKNEVANTIGFKIKYTLIQDEKKCTLARQSKGRFILATNELNCNILCDEDILKEYKEQSSVERGFQFIKNNTFEVDSIFLKKPSRINALMAIMCLCLMVYGFSQIHLRKVLKETNTTVPNQVNKEIQNPTMQWIYNLFHGVHVLTIQHATVSQELVINLNALLRRIIMIFGPCAMAIYDLKSEPEVSVK